MLNSEKITDGKKTMQMVSFDAGLRAQFDMYSKDETPVTISDCMVKAEDGGFELFASPKHSNVTKGSQRCKGLYLRNQEDLS